MPPNSTLRFEDLTSDHTRSVTTATKDSTDVSTVCDERKEATLSKTQFRSHISRTQHERNTSLSNMEVDAAGSTIIAKESGSCSTRRRKADPEDDGETRFTFLTFSHPSEAKVSRRKARSHVTRVQHRVKRQEANLEAEKKARVASGTRSTANSRHEPIDEAAKSSRTVSIPMGGLGARQNGAMLPPQMAMARVDPLNTYQVEMDWQDDVPALVDHYIGVASSFLRLNGLEQESRMIRSDIIVPRLFIDSFLFNALITLTTLRIGVMHAKEPAQEVVSWLRNNFVIMIRGAIEKGVESPVTLAIGLAVLIGWEKEFGTIEACKVHATALPSLLSSDAAIVEPRNLHSYPDSDDRGTFQGGIRLTPGFEFYATQNLLPKRLLFLVGSLNYFNPDVPGARRWMRELWASIGACVPREDAATANLMQRELRSRVAQLVRQAGIMMGSIMRHTANEPPAARPLTEGLITLWSATLGIDWISLLGSVYDEILLWCICVYCAAPRKRALEHMLAARTLLVSMNITTFGQLEALLSRFCCPPCLYEPLRSFWLELERCPPPRTEY